MEQKKERFQENPGSVLFRQFSAPDRAAQQWIVPPLNLNYSHSHKAEHGFV